MKRLSTLDKDNQTKAAQSSTRQHSEAEADPNIEVNFEDLSQEEWNELLASFSLEQEKECLTAHREHRSPALYQNCGRSPTDSSRGSLGQAEDSAWTALLRTIQSRADALTYHSAKMDAQVEILSAVATHVAGIDRRINDLISLIKRQQEATNDLTPKCCCSATLGKLSQLCNK
ncbi:hypothetical protein NDU88_000213 [Pleurodeles waltl]|uniref:Uncharacterized protein n=1 Tax=Pleurodeles waltl TaxID=8319 RepID=A0AAV7VVV5_PLEWA|nr:hypothetical protein NDU88_000213 [Pleurodeles waltl]